MTTSPQVGPHQIAQTRAILDTDQLITLKTVTDNFFQELDQEFSDFKGHVLISQFGFDEPWPTWEVHPAGDELVLLLSGDTDLVLATDNGETITRVTSPGDYIVVPKGTWHTARPHAPTTMLFVTPGEGTLNALEPGGEAV